MILSVSVKRVLSTAIVFAFMGGAAVYSAAPSPETLSFVLDNDVLVPGSRDQDYTGGINISYSSEEVDNKSLYIDAPLNFLDGLFGIEDTSKNIYSIEAGLYGFTPEDTQRINSQTNDRPYASLLYFSNAHERIDTDKNTASQSTLTIGMLGLRMFGNLQNNVHRTTGGDAALGWDRQISDGGELTARYQYSRQSALDLRSFNFTDSNFEVKLTQQVSLGYLTEASLSLGGRYGRLNSAWWSFNPELASYGEKVSGDIGHVGESYVFFGASLKARAYNAFLQGQFRHSEVSYSSHEVNHLLAEAWLGYTRSFGRGFQMSYVVRAHTSEVKKGKADREAVWGGIVISKSW